MAEDLDYIALVQKRFAFAKKAWSDARADFTADLRYISGNPADQWDPAIRNARENDQVPALTFDRLHPAVQTIVNRARQDRPQPKINPGDDGEDETADMLEGKLRHMQYASQADVAYDCAVGYGAGGGFGFYEITREYTSQKGFNQEPRVRRILDPLSQYPDPTAMEPDFSDAEFWFSRQWLTKDAYKSRFGKEAADASSFDADYAPDWVQDDDVCIAEYWWVEKQNRRKVLIEHPELGQMEGYEDELFPGGIEDEDQDLIVNTRDEEIRVIHRDIIDGARKLEEEIWPGQWIPKIPVLGQEIVVEGRRRFISAIRYSRDPQNFINACASSIAEALARRDLAQFLGYTGQFKDQKWTDGKRHKFLEVNPVTIAGQPAPLPQFITYEPPIQALSSSLLMAMDAIKASNGYTDNVLRPGQSNISGIAVQRRDQQADMANYHFEDNLVRAQWHGARVMLDLFMALTDTSRAVRTRKEDGQTSVEPIGVPMSDGTIPLVPGYEDQPHHDIHSGSYEVEISTAPGYESQRDEEMERLAAILQADPQLFPFYADRYFHLLGYGDLEERAELLLPPQIQQAMHAKQQGVSPQEQSLRAQVQQLQAGIQQLLQKLQGKVVETQGRLAVETTKQQGETARDKLKLIGTLITQSNQHAHEHQQNMHSSRMDAIEQLTDMLHESELAPDPNAPQPAPQGAPPV